MGAPTTNDQALPLSRPSLPGDGILANPAPTMSGTTSDSLTSSQTQAETPARVVHPFSSHSSDPSPNQMVIDPTRVPTRAAAPNLAQLLTRLQPTTTAPDQPTLATAHISDPSSLSHSLIPVDDYLNYYQHHIVLTSTLLVSFIPRDLAYAKFCESMDTIQNLLCVARLTTSYRALPFEERFGPSTTSHWTCDSITYPDEEPSHATFVLDLQEELAFGHLGSLAHNLRPMAFELVIKEPTRRLLIQPIPPQLRSTLSRPHIATWRGLGTEFTKGQALAALAG